MLVKQCSLLCWSSNDKERKRFNDETNVIKKSLRPQYANVHKDIKFVPGKPFTPSLMFASKVKAYPSEAPLLHGRLLAVLTHIRLRTNTLAYYEHS